MACAQVTRAKRQADSGATVPMQLSDWGTWVQAYALLRVCSCPLPPAQTVPVNQLRRTSQGPGTGRSQGEALFLKNQQDTGGEVGNQILHRGSWTRDPREGPLMSLLGGTIPHRPQSRAHTDHPGPLQRPYRERRPQTEKPTEKTPQRESIGGGLAESLHRKSQPERPL